MKKKVQKNKCINCKKEFDKLEEVITSYEELYGICTQFNNTSRLIIYVCPFCKEIVDNNEES